MEIVYQGFTEEFMWEFEKNNFKKYGNATLISCWNCKWNYRIRRKLRF